MNSKIIYGLLVGSLILCSCGQTENSSDVSSTTSDTSSNTSSPFESTDSSSVVEGTYVSIDNVNDLFETYASDEDFNFTATYNCAAIADRQYQGQWETTYWYDGVNLSLIYTDGGMQFVDYYIYDENLNQMLYYLDDGSGSYQYLTEDNDYYFQFVSLIDYFELDGIEWEDDMVFDLENKVAKPKDNITKDKVGRQIFGDNVNEYWHELKVYWEDSTEDDDPNKGYISKVEAISIYQEVVYYYTVTLSDHGYMAGSVVVPDNVTEFVDPNKPFYSNKETYTGEALTNEQAAALTMFSNESSMNYTVDVRWNLVVNSEISTTNYLDFHLEAENGNYYYSFEDSQASTLVHKFYLLSSGANYPILFEDEDFDGTYDLVSYGMDAYDSYVGQIFIDRVLLYGLDPKDFIYDEEKGYITAKDYETERTYCGKLFYYTESYGGLRIYLATNDDGSYRIDKIVTSMVAALDESTMASFVKTYTFSNISSTHIVYPEGVTLS